MVKWNFQQTVTFFSTKQKKIQFFKKIILNDTPTFFLICNKNYKRFSIALNYLSPRN